MSCIHFKFKSAIEYRTLTFDGLHISVADLKREICDKERISQTAFDLQLTNAQTKRIYIENSELIPRNSSVIVQRIPAANQQRLPKILDTSKEGAVIRSKITDTSSNVGAASVLMGRTDLSHADMTEQEKLSVAKQISTSAYHPSTFVTRNSIMIGPPPPTYVCNRCNQSGHWIKNCPLIQARRTTGIPREELMETTADDPQAYLHPSGKYVVPRMHKEAFLKGKKERPPFFGDDQPQPQLVAAKTQVPPELLCTLCEDILRDAVLILCCGYSFCDECIRNKLLESETRECPHCHEQGNSVDSLVPNSNMRQAVQNFQNETGYVHFKKRQDTVPMRVRLMPQQPRQPADLPSALTSLFSRVPSEHSLASIVPPVSIPVSSSAAQLIGAPIIGSLPPMTSSAPPVNQETIIDSTAQPISGIHTPVPGVTTPPVTVQRNTNSPQRPPMATVAPMQVRSSVASTFVSIPPVNTISVAPIVVSYQNPQSTVASITSAASTLPVPPGVGPVASAQPPPPGMVGPISYQPRLPAIPRHTIPSMKRDAWDDFLARKDKKRKRRTRSPSSSSSDRSRSRSRSRRRRRNRSASRSRSRTRSRSPRRHRRRSSSPDWLAAAQAAGIHIPTYNRPKRRSPNEYYFIAGKRPTTAIPHYMSAGRPRFNAPTQFQSYGHYGPGPVNIVPNLLTGHTTTLPANKPPGLEVTNSPSFVGEDEMRKEKENKRISTDSRGSKKTSKSPSKKRKKDDEKSGVSKKKEKSPDKKKRRKSESKEKQKEVEQHSKMAEINLEEGKDLTKIDAESKQDISGVEASKTTQIGPEVSEDTIAKSKSLQKKKNKDDEKSGVSKKSKEKPSDKKKRRKSESKEKQKEVQEHSKIAEIHLEEGKESSKIDSGSKQDTLPSGVEASKTSLFGPQLPDDTVAKPKSLQKNKNKDDEKSGVSKKSKEKSPDKKKRRKSESKVKQKEVEEHTKIAEFDLKEGKESSKIDAESKQGRLSSGLDASKTSQIGPEIPEDTVARPKSLQKNKNKEEDEEANVSKKSKKKSKKKHRKSVDDHKSSKSLEKDDDKRDSIDQPHNSSHHRSSRSTKDEDKKHSGEKHGPWSSRTAEDEDNKHSDEQHDPQSSRTTEAESKKHSDEKHGPQTAKTTKDKDKKDSDKKRGPKSSRTTEDKLKKHSDQKDGVRSSKFTEDLDKKHSDEKRGPRSSRTTEDQGKKHSDEKHGSQSSRTTEDGGKKHSDEKLSPWSSRTIDDEDKKHFDEKYGSPSLRTTEDKDKKRLDEKHGPWSSRTTEDEDKKHSDEQHDPQRSRTTEDESKKHSDEKHGPRTAKTTKDRDKKHSDKKRGPKSSRTTEDKVKKHSDEKDGVRSSKFTEDLDKKHSDEKRGPRSSRTTEDQGKKHSDEKHGSQSSRTTADGGKKHSDEKLSPWSSRTIDDEDKKHFDEKYGSPSLRTTEDKDKKRLDEKHVPRSSRTTEDKDKKYSDEKHGPQSSRTTEDKDKKYSDEKHGPQSSRTTADEDKKHSEHGSRSSRTTEDQDRKDSDEKQYPRSSRAAHSVHSSEKHGSTSSRSSAKIDKRQSGDTELPPESKRSQDEKPSIGHKSSRSLLTKEAKRLDQLKIIKKLQPSPRRSIAASKWDLDESDDVIEPVIEKKPKESEGLGKISFTIKKPVPSTGSSRPIVVSAGRQRRVVSVEQSDERRVRANDNSGQLSVTVDSPVARQRIKLKWQKSGAKLRTADHR